MEIRIDGNRVSSESRMRAQAAPPEELPRLSGEQKAYAAKFGLSDEAYAKDLFAKELERRELARRAEKAARVIERMAAVRAPGLHVEYVWLKTLEGKFRFDIEWEGNRDVLFVSEDVMDELLESGTASSEQQIARILEYGLPTQRAVPAP